MQPYRNSEWVRHGERVIFPHWVGNAWDYKKLRQRIGATGGKALYAVRGTCPKDFRMIKAKSVRFVGMLDFKAG